MHILVVIFIKLQHIKQQLNNKMVKTEMGAKTLIYVVFMSSAWKKVLLCNIKSKCKKVQKNTFNYDTDTQYANFQGKSPLSSHKTTLKQQING